MRVHKDVIQEIENAPEGPQIGAFFDFDGTLIAGFSATVTVGSTTVLGSSVMMSSCDRSPDTPGTGPLKRRPPWAAENGWPGWSPVK